MATALHGDDPQIGRVLKEMGTLLQTLEQLSRPYPCESEPRRATDGGLAACDPRTLCRDLYRIRRLRDEILGADLFNDHAWDMMLDLYQAELEGADVTVVSLCAAAQTPQTSGLRIIGNLIERGLLQKRVDAADRRRCFVTLTVRGHRAMHELVSRVTAAAQVRNKAA